MKEKNELEWKDCWVIAGIMWTLDEGKKIKLSKIIGYGDLLNHSIFTEKELKSGFFRAQKKGLITIKDKKIKLTERVRR